MRTLTFVDVANESKIPDYIFWQFILFAGQTKVCINVQIGP